MKLSEELRLRGAVVGDAYGFTKNWDVSPYTYGVYNSSILEDLLSGRHDEGGNFIWLRDKNGIKKEIIK